MIPSKKTKGYLIVASSDEIYYHWACNLLDGIKDFYPEAKICLVTEQRFLDHKADQADKVIICEDHYRSKLWGMANTPWDQTFYMDADMEILHEDIAKVFDEQGESDLMFCALEESHYHVFMGGKFPGGQFALAGAVCLYRKNKLVMEFMQDWYDLYVDQRAGNWWPKNEYGQPDYKLYPEDLAIWDQFTLWWLVNKEPKYSSLIIETFKDTLKWNHWSTLNRVDFPLKDDTVLLHLSARAAKSLSKIEIDTI